MFNHANSMALGVAMSVGCLLVGQSVHHFGPDQNNSTIKGEITMKFCTDIQGPQSISLVDS